MKIIQKLKFKIDLERYLYTKYILTKYQQKLGRKMLRFKSKHCITPVYEFIQSVSQRENPIKMMNIKMIYMYAI